MIRIIVPGIPVGKGRPRVMRRRGHKKGFTFTPEETAIWENKVALCAYEHKPKKLFDCPLFMKVTFWFAKPKSRKKYEWPDRGKDLDNLVKGICDALQGIIYVNDSRIVGLAAIKKYGTPMTKIEIGEVGKVNIVIEHL